MTAELVEKVARWLCEYVGGDPDMVDPHAITDEGKPFHGPLWQVFKKDAHAIIPIVAQHCAEVARVTTPRLSAHPNWDTGIAVGNAIATALEKIGQGDG